MAATHSQVCLPTLELAVFFTHRELPYRRMLSINLEALICTTPTVNSHSTVLLIIGKFFNGTNLIKLQKLFTRCGTWTPRK